VPSTSSDDHESKVRVEAPQLGEFEALSICQSDELLIQSLALNAK